MAEGDRDTSSTNDFGEDLNCSICMQVLFQPLTLLDCLHTFCGACSKDWFAHQAAHARSIHPYTCPQCRASVRDTKRYAFIITLLEKHLKKYPEKNRTEEDKEEHKEKYKPGDNVLPKLRLRERARDPDEDRVMDEVMALSLREAGITDSSSNTLQEPRDTRRRGNSRERRSRNSSRSPAVRPGGPAEPSAQQPSEAIMEPLRQLSARRPPSRSLEHQASLVSLMSASEMDPQEMQEEILRQIAEEGLIGDIDLNNLDASQEEELSERIARAYQQRSEERRRQQRETAAPQDPSSQREPSSQRRSSSRPSSRSGASETASRPAERRRPAAPPISNPQLIDSVNQQSQVRHRRTGSASSTRSAARVDSALMTASPTSTTPPTSRPPTTERRRRLSSERSVTDPNSITTMSRQARGQGSDSAPGTPASVGGLAAPPTSGRRRSGSNPQRSPRLGSAATFPRTVASNSTSSLPLAPAAPISDTASITRPPASAGLVAPSSHQRTASSSSNTRPKLYDEPSVSCKGCGKTSLQYEVHYNCPKCSREHGAFNLCKACYREGRGCHHWFGFGSAAMREYDRRAHELGNAIKKGKPHAFTAERYARPRHPLVPSATNERPDRQLTEDDPASRHEKGVFCDMCSNFANNCYWKCDACNDGAWGFCNSCVNQGKHCTHPLLPLKAMEPEHEIQSSQIDGHLAAPGRPEAEQQPSPPGTPKSASIMDGPITIHTANMSFQPLTFHTLCDICTIPIPPSVTRYHCPQCNGGDYDICVNCYHGLVSTGKISAANGHQGWRKCPQGHRMVVIGFQDAGGGQRRVVDRDLVGGWAFIEDPLTTASNTPSGKWRWSGNDGTEQTAESERRARFNRSRIPPDGGMGLVYYGRWNYFPDGAIEGNDLCFPRQAEIREAEDVNGDWLWGVYAGRKGIFPAAYVSFLRRVGP